MGIEKREEKNLDSSSPIIGITTDFEVMSRPSGKKETAFLYRRYYKIVEECGGIPVLLPPLENPKEIHSLAKVLDGILLTGGDDIHPSKYGQNLMVESFTPLHPLRENWEFRILDLAVTHGIPLLGICLGSQVINVFFGGTLIQDIPSQKEQSIIHKETDKDKGVAFHKIKIHKNSLLYSILKEEEIQVNSFHHQGIGEIGQGLFCSARAEDGIPEALETCDGSFLLGIQWHLEMNLSEQPHSFAIMKAFLGASFQKKRMVS
ncbi:MAG: gamma-glutamyl-gamma-aminobutyrate hydrolase family protein [Planctomycetota bacterium]|nr:MAG: gamma-glutamyl-gamma-aminobutyrate hydrolase family protein [Planctomycetota bacterium]